MSNTWLELKANHFKDSVSLKNNKNMNSRITKDSTTVGDGRQIREDKIINLGFQ